MLFFSKFSVYVLPYSLEVVEAAEHVLMLAISEPILCSPQGRLKEMAV